MNFISNLLLLRTVFGFVLYYIIRFLVPLGRLGFCVDGTHSFIESFFGLQFKPTPHALGSARSARILKIYDCFLLWSALINAKSSGVSGVEPLLVLFSPPKILI